MSDFKNSKDSRSFKHPLNLTKLIYFTSREINSITKYKRARHSCSFRSIRNFFNRTQIYTIKYRLYTRNDIDYRSPSNCRRIIIFPTIRTGRFLIALLVPRPRHLHFPAKWRESIVSGVAARVCPRVEKCLLDERLPGTLRGQVVRSILVAIIIDDTFQGWEREFSAWANREKSSIDVTG